MNILVWRGNSSDVQLVRNVRVSGLRKVRIPGTQFLDTEIVTVADAAVDGRIIQIRPTFDEDVWLEYRGHFEELQ